ncbi:unnamed protein product [Ixodes hexagonus]
MTQRDAPRPESALYTGHAAQPDDEQTIGRLGSTSSSSLCEEDSDSGSWWSYPSECGSVVDLNRVVSFARHAAAADDLDSLRSCFSSLEGDVVVPQSSPSDLVRSPTQQRQQQRSPERRDPRPANVKPSSGRGDTSDNGIITETSSKHPGIPADQVRAALVQVNNRGTPNPTKTFRKSSLVGADDRRPTSAAPSIERHVTFKDLSSPSSGSDEEHYERKPSQYRNRNHSLPAPGCHDACEEKQAFVNDDDVAGEADLDDSGYLDGDSTSSSSDVSPPSSLGWESAIHTSATRKAGGVRDSRGVGQRCPGDHRGDDLFEPEPPKRPDGGPSDAKQAMNGFYGRSNAAPSARAFVHTEISVCESVRREDSYEYYRNGTRVARLNNVNQTSWSESSCTDSSEVCTPLGKASQSEKSTVSAPDQHNNNSAARATEAADDASNGARRHHHHQPLQSAAPRRVLPSLDAVKKLQPNVAPSVEASRKRQPEASGIPPYQRQSAPRESGKPKKENNGGNAWNADGARATTTRPAKVGVAYEDWRHFPACDVRDEGTSCDLEGDDDVDDYDSESEDSCEAPTPSSESKDECADRAAADARAGTVSATATSRAVARSRPGGGATSEPGSRASALASVRAQARDPFLALAVATAKAATTASAEASREIYAGCKPFSAAPDLDVFVRTACSVGGGGDSAALLADRAKQARDMPDSGYVAVSSPYKVSSVRADVHLPTPVRYKEFSSLQLGGASPTTTNGHSELAREPQPCEQRFLHVHSDVLPTREDRSPPTPPPRYATPSPVLREDRVRLLRTPVKSTPVLVDSLPDSDDCDVAAASTSATPSPPVPPPRNPHNGILRMTRRPATLPVNGEATVYRKPPLPQQPPQQHQQQQRLLRPPPPPPPVRQRSPPADPAEHLERITGYHTARRLAQALPKPQVILPDQPYSHPGGRLVSSRRRFFENLQRQVVAAAADPEADSPSERLLGFQASAQAARESLAKSSPDLAALEADAFRRSRSRPDRYPPCPDATSPPCPAVAPRSPAVPPESFSRLVEETRNRYLLRRRHRGSPGQDERRRSKSLGYLETDVDTLQCRQVKRTPDAPDLAAAAADYAEDEPARAESPLSRARSMDHFLDDDVNAAGLGERAKSEHELRVERSLQKLQLPDWYKRHSRPPESGFLRSRCGSTASTTSTGRPSWQGLGSRTPSAASLAATSASAPTSNARNLVIPKRVTAPDWRCWHASRESLSSGCASPHDGSLSRWGSVSSAPAAAWSYRSFRQPYLGWRATPSTGTTTPMSTGSRPVSPGAPLWTPPPAQPPHQQQPETSEVERSTASSVLRSSPHPPPCNIPRDRYSYVQGIYGDGGGWNDEHDVVQQDVNDGRASSSLRQHRQLDEQHQEVMVSDARPAVWMESSFVGAKPGSSPASSPTSAAAALGEYARSVGITL